MRIKPRLRAVKSFLEREYGLLSLSETAILRLERSSPQPELRRLSATHRQILYDLYDYAAASGEDVRVLRTARPRQPEYPPKEISTDTQLAEWLSAREAQLLARYRRSAASTRLDAGLREILVSRIIPRLERCSHLLVPEAPRAA